MTGTRLQLRTLVSQLHEHEYFVSSLFDTKKSDNVLAVGAEETECRHLRQNTGFDIRPTCDIDNLFQTQRIKRS
jgi:hypothetical protein